MILDSTHYPAIRAALDISLTAADLPDATIALPLYLGAADRAVKRRDPQWATRVGDELSALQAAAIYVTAALLSPAVPNFRKETIGRGDHSYEATNPGAIELARLLLGRANSELATIPDLVPTLAAPGFFALAPGGRAHHRGVFAISGKAVVIGTP